MSCSGSAKPLSKDHKPNDENERQRIYKAGGFVRYDRLNGRLSLSRGFGDLQVMESGNANLHKKLSISSIKKFC